MDIFNTSSKEIEYSILSFAFPLFNLSGFFDAVVYGIFVIRKERIDLAEKDIFSSRF